MVIGQPVGAYAARKQGYLTVATWVVWIGAAANKDGGRLSSRRCCLWPSEQPEHSSPSVFRLLPISSHVCNHPYVVHACFRCPPVRGRRVAGTHPYVHTHTWPFSHLYLAHISPYFGCFPSLDRTSVISPVCGRGAHPYVTHVCLMPVCTCPIPIFMSHGPICNAANQACHNSSPKCVSFISVGH